MAEYNFNHNVLNYIHLKLFPQKKKKKPFPLPYPLQICNVLKMIHYEPSLFSFKQLDTSNIYPLFPFQTMVSVSGLPFLFFPTKILNKIERSFTLLRLSEFSFLPLFTFSSHFTGLYMSSKTVLKGTHFLPWHDKKYLSHQLQL